MYFAETDAAAEAIAQRRQARVKNISTLVETEKTRIMEISNALSELRTKVKPSGKSKGHVLEPPKNESRRLELSLEFLLACESFLEQVEI